MNLQEFFKENPKVALAFSGGVDSSYLLYAAMKYGADVKAYYVKALFQPQFEMDDAMRLAEQLKAPVRVLRADVLSDPVVVSNPSNRCYYCKKVIFNMIMKAAAEDGYTVLLDGTNASDDAGDRPGMKALQELQVKSPLRECGLVKSEIRRLSKEGGLFTWDKPSYACLATRIPTGCEITAEKLQKTEAAENFLFSLGFSDFRVRMMPNGAARLQVLSSQLPLLMEKQGRDSERVKEELSGCASGSGGTRMNSEIRKTLEAVKNGELSVDDALLAIKKEPFEDIGYASRPAPRHPSGARPR